MQVAMLNKKEKEELVVRLYRDDKTIRQIAETVHMSFNDIGKIIKRINGHDNDINLSNKSKSTQALYLFELGKKPIDIAIELDISYSEVIDLQQEYWALKELYDLPLVYQELKHDFDLFLRLFRLLKKNRMLSEQHILKILRNAGHDLPSLEDKIRRLTRDVIDLEWKKKQLKDDLVKLSSSKSQLEKLHKRYHMEIGLKKEIVSNLDQQLNQKSNALEELSTQANKQLESVRSI